ncbi:MAG: glycosyltransferase [Telluria sp.]
MSRPWSDRIRPVHLAWLLRADLRGGHPAGAPATRDFHAWWNLSGRADYPVWAEACPPGGAAWLEPLEDWPRFRRFGMYPALLHILERRADIRSLLDDASPRGIWHTLAWFFVHGIREYRLLPCVCAELLSELDSVPPFFAAEPAASRPTWLMFFAWRASAELQAHFDLRRLSQRHHFIEWFNCKGIAALQLDGLVAARWKHWMLEPVELLPGVAVVRAGVLEQHFRPELRGAFPPSPGGIRRLRTWSEDLVATDPSLQWLRAPAAGALEPQVRQSRPFGVNLIGFAQGELGIGEDVRMAAAACAAAGVPFSIVNIQPGHTVRQGDQSLDSHLANQGEAAPYAVNLLCLTGFDTVRVALERGAALFEGRTNIGWWPWELPVWPRAWAAAFTVVDEIWAATRFTERMYRTAVTAAGCPDLPVIHMPMAADVGRRKPLARADLGLPVDRFLFLYVFDFNSYLARKNPFAAVEAFTRAFARSDRSVGLVLKTMNAVPGDPAWQRFLRRCARDERIIVLDRTLDRGDVLGLIEQCDAYLSLHRAEGFGRTLAEAMLFGKPVVATDFSGNADFLDRRTGFPVPWHRRAVRAGEYPFVASSDGAWWAEPDLEAAAAQLRAARASVSADGAFARRLRRHSAATFSPARVGERMRRRLRELGGGA